MGGQQGSGARPRDWVVSLADHHPSIRRGQLGGKQTLVREVAPGGR